MPETIFQALFDELTIAKATLATVMRSMQREDMPVRWQEEVIELYNQLDEYMSQFHKTWIEGPTSW